MDGTDLSACVANLPRPLMAGLSGGADSVALLLALWDANPVGLRAVHVNHGLRGEAAGRDEDFCRALCEGLGIPLTVRRLSLPPDSGEDAARQSRYRSFSEACREAGCDTIALAHHLDDRAETLLMRLMRGSGGRGLAALPPAQMEYGLRVVRPLLNVSHSELCDWLTRRGQAWVEDETNREPVFLRNRVRWELLPLMEEMTPGVSRRLAHTAQLLREDEDALSGWAASLIQDNCGPRWLRLAALNGAPKAVASRALRLWWERSPANLSEEHSLSLPQTEALATLLSSPPGCRCNLPSGWRAERGARYLHLLPPGEWDAVRIKAGDGASIGGLTVTVAPGEGAEPDGRSAIILPMSLLRRCELRAALPGDRITPVHSGHSRPLREYLRSRGVEPGFRAWLPLLCAGSQVLMAPGLGRGDIPREIPGDGPVLLRWTGPMPWTDTDTEEH